MPSFVVLVIIGYLFTTTSGPKGVNISELVPLCGLGLLSMVLSSLSIFYFISFIGGFLTLLASVTGFTKPTFKTLSREEASFLVEVGAMFVASASSLLVLMWLISDFFQTYALGLYVGYSPYPLLLVAILSLLVFFAIPFIDSRGKNTGWCGAFGLIMTIVSLLFVLQNRYSFLNATASLGFFLLAIGYISSLTGDLIFVRLFFTEVAEQPTILISSPLQQGKFCPYCGKPRDIIFQAYCNHCRRSLLWSPYAPFCPSCGQLVPSKAQDCPHCQENITDKRTYFRLQNAKEQATAERLVAESTKKKSFVVRSLSRMKGIIQPAGQARQSTRMSMALVDAVLIISITCISSIVFFWALRIVLLAMAK